MLKELLRNLVGVERIGWHAKITCCKYDGDINECNTPEERLAWLASRRPYQTIVREHNCLLNNGMDEIFYLITGQGTPTEYDNTNAQIGVGNSNTAAARTQTALQGGSSLYKGMEASYPTTPAENDGANGRSVKFKSSFGTSEANFAWEEWAVRNGATADKLLNRKVDALGTKSTGTWTLEVEISLS